LLLRIVAASLSNCNIGLDGVQALANALKDCPTLRILRCDAAASAGTFNRIFHLTPDPVSLASRPMWRSLDNNNIGREGAFALAPALKDCRALRRLSIASNGIGKKGGKVILSGIKDCPTLIQL